MRTRRHNILLIFAVLVAVATVVQDVRFDLALARERTVAHVMEQDFAAVETALAGWRAAQAGYVAVSQGPAMWVDRADSLAARIESAVGRRAAATASGEARTQYDLATAALADLVKLDGRARDLTLAERRFEAADLVFGEASGPAQRLADAVAGARSAERAASQTRIVNIRWARLGMNALALGVLVLAIVLFRRRAGHAEREAEQARAALEAPPSQEGVVSPARPAAAAASTVNLPAAAEVCVDLSRVMDSREVPALLERTAAVLGAKGMVLWVADPSGVVLRPSLVLGYPQRVVDRLGVIQVDGDNVTALAYRSRQSQALNGAKPSAPGAIAVPLVAGTGCVGVLAAEISRTKPDQDTLAVARMIGAQVAALVAPVEPAPEVRTARG